MARVIGGDYSTEVQLTLASDNPVTVTGTISVASGIALSGNAAVDWCVYNEGLIAANASGSGINGIYLAAFGNVTNTGTITAWEHAVQLELGGSVSNAAGGTIGGHFIGILVSNNLTTQTQAGTVTNAGTITYGPGNYSENGVFLGFGGSVTNLQGAIIQVDRTGVYIANASGSVVNAGTIITSKTLGPGVRLVGTIGTSEYLSNASTGLINSAGYGVSVGAGTATIINYGTISSNIRYGVVANSGGTITNGVGATITGGGFNGVRLWNGPRAVFNQGLINATETSAFFYGANRYGINLTTGTIGPAYVSNAARGTIIGVSGIGVGGASGTVVNAGTIEATAPGGDAVIFWKGQADTLIVDPGAVFVGTLNGGNAVGATAISTLELASAASTGTLSGIGSQYINFAQITIDPGASWQMTGTNSISSGATLTNSGTLKLLAASLTDNGVLVNNGVISVDPSMLTVASIGGVGTVDIGSNSTLTVYGAVSIGETIMFTGTNAVLNILRSSSFAGTILGQGPTDVVNIACFATRTCIATERGEVAVEDLAIGELVHAQFAGTASVKWIGRRRVDCRRHPKPQKVWPVRVHAGAFGPGMPHRDLWLSPDHAVFVGGMLIPVKHLINGTSIEQVPMDEVTYYHVELPKHDLLLAEGLPAESYLDTGGRCNFENGGGPVGLLPDFGMLRWEAEGCAPLIVAGPELDGARRLVNSRAPASGHVVHTAWRAA